MSVSSTISIGPEFFQGEKRNYSHWPTAVVREFLQNVFDAGANDVKFTYRQIDEKRGELTCTDNGKGMSRQILENIYLALGKTTKNDGSTAGGFGKARILTCWAQYSYSIRSKNWFLEGSGANYTINDAPMHVSGCEFKIITDHADWPQIIRDVLTRCGNKGYVYINGVLFTEYAHRGRFIRRFSFGDVYVNKSANVNRLDVRVNGAWMFSKHINAKAQVFVEINPEKSREILTSNRDGLMNQYSDELDAFLRELASETMSALKPRRAKFNKIISPGQGFLTQGKHKVEEKPIAASTTNFSVAARVGAQESTNTERGSFSFEAMVQAALLNQTDPILRYSMVINEHDNPAVDAIAKRFDPSILTPDTTRFKLLKVWNHVCKFVLNEFAELTGESVLWGAGFVFSEDTIAKFYKVDGVNYYLINPIGRDLKIKYSINKYEDLCELICSVCHEVTHTKCLSHDESFANLFGMLVERVMKKHKELIKSIKELR